MSALKPAVGGVSFASHAVSWLHFHHRWQPGRGSQGGGAREGRPGRRSQGGGAGREGGPGRGAKGGGGAREGGGTRGEPEGEGGENVCVFSLASENVHGQNILHCSTCNILHCSTCNILHCSTCMCIGSSCTTVTAACAWQQHCFALNVSIGILRALLGATSTSVFCWYV